MTKRGNIAIFSLSYAPFVGGAELAVEEITKRILLKFMCFTHKFDVAWKDKELIDNVQVSRLGGGVSSRYGNIREKIMYIFRSLSAAEKEHKKEPFTLIWGIMASYAGFGALLFKLRHPTIPFLLTLQEGDSEEHILRRVGIFYPLWKLIFKKADYIQVISNYLREFALRHGATCPIEVIPNGVDLEKFQHVTPIIRMHPKNSDISDRFTIITTSRLVYKNGIDILIRACALLDELGIRNWKLEIIGDGPLKQDLKKLAQELHIENRVQFLGHILPDDIPKYLVRANVFVRPSRSEGLGSSFLEAMAMGIPIIGTSVGGIPDFLKDEKTGLFACLDDVHDLARVMYRMLTDMYLRIQVINAGQALVEKEYSWSYIAKKMENIFDTVYSSYRIAIVSGIVPPEIGGPAYYSVRLLRAFQSYGDKVKLIGYKKLKRLPTGLRHFLFSLKLFFSFILSRPFFIIALDTFSVGFPAVFVGKILRIPVVIRTGGDFLWEQYVERTREKILFSDFYEQSRSFTNKEKFIFRITQWTLQRADYVVFSTAHQQTIFIAAYGLEKTRTGIIENYYEKASSQIRDPNQKNFICFTRQLAWKNIDTLEQAFAKAKLHHPDILLETGELSREKYLEKLRTCYAVILVSLGDISPNMILEAVANGKPFILTKENGLENRLQGIGLRVDPLDELEIADMISRLADPHTYQAEQEKISNFSFQHSYNNIAQEFLDIAQNI